MGLISPDKRLTGRNVQFLKGIAGFQRLLQAAGIHLSQEHAMGHAAGSDR